MDKTLYLIPSPLGDYPPERVLPDFTIKVIRSLSFFIAEEAKSARRFLARLLPHGVMPDIVLYNEHSRPTDLTEIMKRLLHDGQAGLISEAGAPCVADPGATLVRLAHLEGIKVVPLTGPSSILLALMASGFNGQSFVFHGYLPVERVSRIRKIKELEKECFSRDQTQIFIETPYRNRALLTDLIATCKSGTMLSVAINLTTPDEMIITRSIDAWKSITADMHKKPAVFLLYH